MRIKILLLFFVFVLLPLAVGAESPFDKYRGGKQSAPSSVKEYSPTNQSDNPNQEIDNQLKKGRSKKPLVVLPELKKTGKFYEGKDYDVIRGEKSLLEKNSSGVFRSDLPFSLKENIPIRSSGSSKDCVYVGYAEDVSKKYELLDCGSYYLKKEIKE